MITVKSKKCFSMMLVSLLFIGAILAGSTVPVTAPVTEPIKLYAVTTGNPGPGYYGGYFPIMQAIQTELAKINITLEIVTKTDNNWYNTVWTEPTWNRSGDWNNDGHYTSGQDGWDFTTCEWWMNPTSYIWLDELVYSWNTPPKGYNIMSWNNPTTDSLWREAQTTLDPTVHNEHMWDWQAEFMHNPPVIPLYYADQMTARGAYVDGFDETAWVYDLSQLDINETIFNDPLIPIPATRRAQGSNYILWGSAEPIYNYFTLGVNTYTEEQMNVLKQGMLYRTSREKLKFPASGNYFAKTTLATAFPTWRQITDLDGKQKWVARVPIVQGLNWTDDIPFNATDVAFSYNAMLDIDNKGFAYGDYWFLMNRTEVVDPYTVDFIYNPGMGPDYDFAGYNAHGWGIGMIPWHQLKNEDLTTWRNAPFNSDPVPKSKGGKGVECLGPYVPISQNPSDKSITFERRDQYINVLGWANTLPQYYVMKIIQDDGARWTQLNNLEVDVIEYPTKPLQDWINMNTTGKHKVYSFKYPAMHPLWMNLQNPILSNRYVRLAIAHAIPYPKIFNDILPGWGVSQAYYGKSFVLPIHGSFNTALGNYEYNIDKAKQYMDMWRYSQATLDPSKGPRGDHDFSGYVGVDDFPIWAKWRGKTPSQWTFKPGNDIDPDNDNDADVDVADYTSWAANYGKRYPFNGAW